MYEAYWQLKRKPFACGIDTDAYYPSESHQAALLKLRYAVESRSGAALLAGAPGSGKTMLVQMLETRLSEEFTPLVHVVFPQMSAVELLSYLAAQLGAPEEASPRHTIDECVLRIQRVLAANAARGRHAVVAIDEAHLLDGARTLEALRLLLNFEQGAQPALTMLLIGQTAVLPMLQRTPHWDDRLGVKCLVRALALEETMSYVEHRLLFAGAKRTIFATAALETIHRLTHGVPRRINRLCDLALLIGFAEERSILTPVEIEAVANELVTVSAD
jgi:type II secretory pathway predicted ATPase ExeA